MTSNVMLNLVSLGKNNVKFQAVSVSIPKTCCKFGLQWRGLNLRSLAELNCVESAFRGKINSIFSSLYIVIM
jgi:hypothetical protein